MYPIISVPNDAPDNPEQLGTKRKFWYFNEAAPTLFKEGRPGTGENWAEKACCEICALLGIPHAHYDFADWRDHDGVVSPSFVPRNGRLILGNELLARVIQDYPQTQRYQARQHTVGIVLAILRSAAIGLPIGYKGLQEIVASTDLFVGYLMLDALVGNQDRHHENWGLILDSDKRVTLAPTFDHASSLGRNETDGNRVDRLTTKDQGRGIERFVARARSGFFSHDLREKRPIFTIDAFAEAAGRRPVAANYWLKSLERIPMDSFREIFERIPADLISRPAIDFALRMIEVNRNRLLDLSK